MIRIALAQCNSTVGDMDGNALTCERLIRDAASDKADLVVFPEMVLTGYPAEDLVLRQSFRRNAVQAAERLATATKDVRIATLVGGLWEVEGRPVNAALWIEGGKVRHVIGKCALPNYGVFDEKRLFRPGDRPKIVKLGSLRCGILICEDLWDEAIVLKLIARKPDIVLVLNASPYETGKAQRRTALVRKTCHRYDVPVLYVNLVGGQDELVFDGGSFVMHPDGRKPVRLPRFEEALVMTDWQKRDAGWRCRRGLQAITQDDCETVYHAMMVGLRDYVEKAGFAGVVIGLSGGIDSALTAAVAADALGPERVHTVLMPSPYTSAESDEDARLCAAALGIELDVIPIAEAMATIDRALEPVFHGRPVDTTEENIQARLRGNLLMAISNKLGSMVITTGNKSEMSVGYATLYGDMCGGYSVLKDVYKTTVFRLSEWRNGMVPTLSKNKRLRVIPPRIISKPPSAELRHDQRDDDSLPPYNILDPILLELIEHQTPIPAIIAMGFDAETVHRVSSLIYRAEYKRRQAPPGVKISGMAFGRDRRYPIINRYNG